MSSNLKDSRGRSKYWIASFTNSEGRRLKRSKKTTDSELAKKLAQEWDVAGKAGRAGRLVESQCRKVLAQIYEVATGKPLHFRTARSWFNGWLEEKKVSISPRTFLKYDQIVREFIAHLDKRADAMLAEIVEDALKSFRNSLTRSGHSPATVNGAWKILRIPFSLAHQLGYVAANPYVGVALSN